MKCHNCQKHRGNEVWLGQGSTMDYIHGNFEMFCKCCILKVSLEYAKKQVERIAGLEKQLKKVKCK